MNTATIPSNRVTPAEVAACRARFEADARLAPQGHLRGLAAQQAAAEAAWSVDGTPVRSAFAIELARPTTPSEIEAAVAAWVAAEERLRADVEADGQAAYAKRVAESTCDSCGRCAANGETAGVRIREYGEDSFRWCDVCAQVGAAMLPEAYPERAEQVRRSIARKRTGARR